MHPTFKRCCYAMSVLLLLAGSVRAGVLFGNGGALLSGNEAFTGFKAGASQLKANVDYAVFAPGAFAPSLALPLAEDPSAGTEYVYAYEIFNTGNAITSLSIGLNPAMQVVTLATNWGDAPSAGGTSPSLSPTLSGFFPLANPITTKSNVKWQYPTLGPWIANGGHSTILLFTSPLSPGFDTASITTSSVDTNPVFTDFLPSPIPEPSTLVLAAVAGCGLMAVGYRRKRRVR